MLTREQILAAIDRAYSARKRGDKAEISALWAQDGTYGLAGDAALRHGIPAGSKGATATVAELVDLFKYHECERIDEVVDGSKAASRCRVVVSVEGKPPVSTEILDFWTFADDGRVMDLIQYADTALIAHLVT